MVKINSNTISSAEPQASIGAVARGVAKAAAKAWQKNYVKKAVKAVAWAICPMMRASDEILVSKADMLREVRMAEL